jgi:DNA-binding NarL/FixJ family response regulator
MKKFSVILADDNRPTRQVLTRLLKANSDIKVVAEAKDGEEAVYLTRKIVPDIVLMDIDMPKMDGIKATRIIHSEFSGIRVIALSGYERAELASEIINAGACSYWSKSDKIDFLFASIRGETA